MSGQYLNVITENATRLGQRIQESFSEHTRELNINRAIGSAYLDTVDDGGKALRAQLDSNSDREKLNALKRLVAMISKGRNVSEYFAQVVKNVASPNLEIRKLVYIYLLRYAEQEPDLALLSINTFQKDLADSNPLIRAMALRVLSGIKVPMIGSIIALAIKRCGADISPYVRKTASLAIPKCYDLDSSHQPALMDVITTLFADRSPLSIGSTVVAFEGVFPTRLDLLHKHYRRLCKTLIEVDEWGQVTLTNVLLRYARTMLTKPTDGEIDSDVKLLLTSVEPLFLSINPAVVLAAARVIFYLNVPSYLHKLVHPLLRLLALSKEIERVVLVYITTIALLFPNLFAFYYLRFLVTVDDATAVKTIKINLLLQLLTVDNCQVILREMVDYADDSNDEVVSAAIQGIGECSNKIPETTSNCLKVLIPMVKSPYAIVVSNAVVVLQNLVQKQLASRWQTLPAGNNNQSPFDIIAYLAQRVDDIKHAQARSCIIWLIGQYASSRDVERDPEGIATWAPDVLRKSARSFVQESSLVKLQIVTLAAKLFVLDPFDSNLGLLCNFVMTLAKYDTDYDVRDRARMLTALIVGIKPLPLSGLADIEDRRGVILRREQVHLILLDGKSPIASSSSNHSREGNALGSLSSITGKFPVSDNLPDWPERGVEMSLRDSKDETHITPPPLFLSSTSSGAPSQVLRSVEVLLTPTQTNWSSNFPATRGGMFGLAQDLDAFYADAEGDDEEESEENEEDDENNVEDVGNSGDDEEDDDDDDEEDDDDDDDDHANDNDNDKEEVREAYNMGEGVDGDISAPGKNDEAFIQRDSGSSSGDEEVSTADHRPYMTDWN